MPLFGPNIDKMRKRGDTNGLTEALKSADAEVRVAAAEALKDIGGKALESLCSILVSTLKFGDSGDKIEATAIMQGYGRMNLWIERSVRAKIQKRVPLDLVRPALLETAEEDQNLLVRWHALLALAELGEHDGQVLVELVATAEKLMAAYYDDDPVVADIMRMKTLRALSFAKNNAAAAHAIINASKGSVLVPKYANPPFSADFYALGALGDPSTREFLEFWANRGRRPGEEGIQKTAQIALELFGTATYDEIEKRVEAERRT
jgi:hypothetical protein